VQEHEKLPHPFNCQECFLNFDNLFNLNIHVRAVHGPICPNCLHDFDFFTPRGQKHCDRNIMRTEDCNHDVVNYYVYPWAAKSTTIQSYEYFLSQQRSLPLKTNFH
jgi:hypothetical protein